MQDLCHEEKTAPRGRPRPEETIRRDEHVLRILRSGAMSRNRLWEKLSAEGDLVSPSQVWLSLDRLRRDGRVKLCQGIGERVWTCKIDEPCP